MKLFGIYTDTHINQYLDIHLLITLLGYKLQLYCTKVTNFIHTQFSIQNYQNILIHIGYVIILITKH